MAYNQETAFRIKKAVLSQWDDMTEKKMFGGSCHFLHGHIVCGIHKENLVLRVGAEQYVPILQLKHVMPFDITGKPMKGWVMIEPKGFNTDEKLTMWVTRAREFVETLPPKY